MTPAESRSPRRSLWPWPSHRPPRRPPRRSLPPPPHSRAAASQPADPAAVLQGAERIGAGRFTAYRKGASTLVVLPPGSVGKPLLWYTEVVRVPAGAVTPTRACRSAVGWPASSAWATSSTCAT